MAPVATASTAHTMARTALSAYSNATTQHQSGIRQPDLHKDPADAPRDLIHKRLLVNTDLPWQPRCFQPLRTSPLPGDVRMTPKHDELRTTHASPMGGDQSNLPGALKVNVRLRPKPDEATTRMSPVSPTHLKEATFDSRYMVPEGSCWPYESPRHVFSVLAMHSAQQPQHSDMHGGYSHMGTATKLLSPLQQLQLQQQQPQQQHNVFMPALQTSPMGSRLAPSFYASPVLPATHTMTMTQSMPPMFTPTPTGVHMGDHAMFMGDQSMFLPHSSPTNILKHLLPPVTARHPSVNVKDLTLNELRPHFNKPMAVVAKELGVCITLMKKICRRNGLIRWPHRRIRSLVNRITSLQVIAGNSTGAEKKRFQSQIVALREELSAVIQNPNEKSRKAQADAKARSPSAGLLKKDADDGMDDDDDDDDDDMAGSRPSDDTISNGASSTSTSPSGSRRNSANGDIAMREGDDPSDRREQLQLDNDALIRKALASTAHLMQKRAPPPIEIPGYGSDSERPSSTTSTSSSKRGSISSILCDVT